MKNFLSGYFEELWLRIVRHNETTGCLEVGGTALLPPTYTNLSDSNLPSPVGKGGLAVFLSGVGLHGSTWQSDNSQFWPINGGRILIDLFASPIQYVHPAATFTGVVASSYNGGLDTKLTGADIAKVHGLSNANSVGKYLNITAGAGWNTTIGQAWHLIKDTTTAVNEIIIDTPFNSQASPTVTLLNNYIAVRSIALPPLRSASWIMADLSVNGGGAVGVKTFRAELNSVATPTPISFWTPSSTANNYQSTSRLAIRNVESTAVQTNTLAANNVTQTGTGASAPVAGNIETNAGSTLILYAKNGSADESVGFLGGLIEVII